MSTTTTRDRGDRYGPMEWAQLVVAVVYALSNNVATYGYMKIVVLRTMPIVLRTFDICFLALLAVLGMCAIPTRLDIAWSL